MLPQAATALYLCTTKNDRRNWFLNPLILTMFSIVGLRGSMLSRAMSTTRETRRFARDTRRLGKIEQELDFQVGREVSGRTIPKPTRVILDATDKVSRQRRQLSR